MEYLENIFDDPTFRHQLEEPHKQETFEWLEQNRSTHECNDSNVLYDNIKSNQDLCPNNQIQKIEQIENIPNEIYKNNINQNQFELTKMEGFIDKQKHIKCWNFSKLLLWQINFPGINIGDSLYTNHYFNNESVSIKSRNFIDQAENINLKSSKSKIIEKENTFDFPGENSNIVLNQDQSSHSKVIISTISKHEKKKERSRIKIKTNEIKKYKEKNNSQKNKNYNRIKLLKKQISKSKDTNKNMIYNTKLKEGFLFLHLWEKFFKDHKTSVIISYIQKELSSKSKIPIIVPGKSTIYVWSKLLKTYIFLNLSDIKNEFGYIFNESFLNQNFQDLKSSYAKTLKTSQLKKK